MNELERYREREDRAKKFIKDYQDLWDKSPNKQRREDILFGMLKEMYRMLIVG